MRHMTGILIGVLLVSIQLGMAQTQERPKYNGQGYGYGSIGGLFGGGAHSTASQFGGGAEGIFYKGLGASVDGSYLFPTKQFSAGFGTVSPGVLYQFPAHQKTVPFVTGGYTLGFRDGVMNMMHFGGGATYWFSERVGLRIEARDYIPTTNSRYHYFFVRFGIAGR